MAWMETLVQTHTFLRHLTTHLRRHYSEAEAQLLCIVDG